MPTVAPTPVAAGLSTVFARTATGCGLRVVGDIRVRPVSVQLERVLTSLDGSRCPDLGPQKRYSVAGAILKHLPNYNSRPDSYREVTSR
jgi:hypothetical protein